MSCGRFLKDGPKSDCNSSCQGVAEKGSVCIFPQCEQLRDSAPGPGKNPNNTLDPFSRETGRWSLLFRRELSVLIGSLIGLAPGLPGLPHDKSKVTSGESCSRSWRVQQEYY